MREGPMLRLGIEAALLASRGEPYLNALGEGFASLLGIETGIGLVTWSQIDRPEDASVSVSVAGGPGLSPGQIEAAGQVVARHPTYATLQRVGTACPVRTSDHVAIREFWSTDVWQHQHGFCDGRYPIGFAVASSPTEVKFVGMHRSDRDFGDDEVSALAGVQRLLVAALQFRSSLDDAAAQLQDPGLLGVEQPGNYRPSRREAEVLSLVTRGWTNYQIARRLGISERTVRKHLGAVYDKAGVSGRAAAAVWWQALPSRHGGSHF
jgi:DNA-binding CsgD family transcriptional regulator